MGCCGKVAGAIKLVRAETGVRTMRDVSLVQARRAACEACPSWDHGRCDAPNPETGKPCRCYTWAKTLLKGEKCPLGKWDL